MSWGVELWDGFDDVLGHTLKGIEFCEKYTHFTKERCQIENEYAAKLKRLVKNYQPKKKDEDANDFTWNKAFLKMIGEVHDMAGQHEVISEALQNNIVKEIQALTHELKQERKKFGQDGANNASSLKSQMNQLDKSKRQYEKAFKESEKASDNFRRADADINLSRAEIEKARSTMRSKQATCDECKNDYAAELGKTNTAQTNHYHTLMPQTFQKLQELEERRISRLQGFIKQGADIEKSVIPIVNTCIEGMFKAADSIQSAKDTQSVIDLHKSGFEPPGDIAFEDLSQKGQPENGNVVKTTPKVKNSAGTQSTRNKKQKRTGLGKLFAGGKSDETKEDFSHLPPSQQRKELTRKLDNFKKSIDKETAGWDALQKMRDVYMHNPSLGDASSLDKQLEENARKIDALKQDMRKYETYLAEMDNPNGSTSDLSKKGSSLQSIPNNGDDDSKASTPDSSRHSVNADTPNFAAPQLQTQDSFDDVLDDDDEFTPVGTCTALYSFPGDSDGSIPMTSGEVFTIIEQDQGDGWTQVGRDNGDRGFVPTSYVECHLYT